MRVRTEIKLIAAVCACVAAFAGLTFGWRWLNAMMFSENPVYTVKNLEIVTQLATTPQQIQALTSIHEGINIFSFNASRKRSELLRNVPNLAEARIEKILPDTVRITTTDRLPVLRIAATNFAVDSRGTVMAIDEAQRRRWVSLPVLTEGTRKINVVPGQTLSGRAALALDIINVYNTMAGISFRIDSIDVGGRIYLILQMAEGHREIRLAWSEMTSQENMRTALRMASEALGRPNAATLIRFDVLLSTMMVYGI